MRGLTASYSQEAMSGCLNHPNLSPEMLPDSEENTVRFALQPFDSDDVKLFKTVKTTALNKHKETIYKALDTTIMDLADEISYSLHDLEDAISLKMIDKKMWRSTSRTNPIYLQLANATRLI